MVSGADWQAVGPFGGSILSIDAQQDTLLAGARNGQLFRSTDRGRTWSQLSFGRHLLGNVQVVAIDAAAPAHYIAGIAGQDVASNGLWDSFDAGVTWTQSLRGLAVEALAMHGRKLAVGTRDGLYLNGARVTPSGNADLIDVVSVALDEQAIYVGTPHLPWKSTDGGATWTPIHTGMIDDSDVFSIHISGADPRRIYASACSGIYRSLDAAAHWKMLDGIPNTSRRTHIIAEDPRDANVVFAGTTAGLFRSTDAGETWQRLHSFQVNSLAFNSGELLAATENVGVQTSVDHGQTFRPLNTGLHARNVEAAATNGSLLYAATAYEREDGGVFLAAGTGWRRVASPSAFEGANVHSVATGPKTIFAATEKKVFQSSDGGRAWAAVRGQSPANILAVAATLSELWVGARDGLYRGAEKVANVAGPIQSILISGKSMLVRGPNAAFLSINAGSTWRRLEGSVLFDAAVCQGAVLLATSQSLRNPTAPVVGIPEGTVSAVAFHPSDCRRAYAVQFGRLYSSRDGGRTWAALDIGQPLPDVSRLWITQADPNGLFAIVPGAGIWRRSLPLD